MGSITAKLSARRSFSFIIVSLTLSERLEKFPNRPTVPMNSTSYPRSLTLEISAASSLLVKSLPWMPSINRVPFCMRGDSSNKRNSEDGAVMASMGSTVGGGAS